MVNLYARWLFNGFKRNMKLCTNDIIKLAKTTLNHITIEMKYVYFVSVGQHYLVFLYIVGKRYSR